MLGILGKKIGMTTFFEDSGNAIPCTVIEAGPCVVTQIKTKDKDGYIAVKVGFGTKKEKRIGRPQRKEYQDLKIAPPRFIKELRDLEIPDLKVGDEIKVSNIFKTGDKVKVTGTSKGKGFQGVVKRHGFGGGVRTHGQSDRERAPGSIGGSSYPSRVFKGQRMAGRMGGDKVTVKNLKVVKIIPDSNLILIKGAIPGANSGLVEIYKN
jgi:large subunit ribosomal protein L3